MTVTVVLSKIDAERALPWDHEGPHTGAQQRNYGRAIAPSVKWLTTPEPLVCQTCRGKGWWWFRTVQHDCLDCNGTGRPDVEIVSQEIQRKLTVVFCHGVVPIGAAVPIVSVLEPVTDENCDTEEIVVGTDGRVWLKGTDITGQFGSQALIGHAHLIQPKETIE